MKELSRRQFIQLAAGSLAAAGLACSKLAPTVTPTPGRIGEPTSRPTLRPDASTTPAATATTVATAEASATPAGVGEFQMIGDAHPFAVENNMDVGDAKLTSVVQAWDTRDPKSTFEAYVEPLWNLDFEAPKIEGTFWQFTGDQKAIQARATEMAAEAGGVYRLYVGANEAPDGWTKKTPDGWTMSTWVYTEEPIDVPSADWDRVDINGEVFGDKKQWNYLQGWDGKNAKVLYHVIIEPGAQVDVNPEQIKQGADFKAALGDPEEKGLLLSRFHQMTTVEVADRDKDQLTEEHPLIHMIYVGRGEAPSGWTKVLPSGWTTVVDP